MKKSNIIGTILFVVGLFLAWFLTVFFQGCVGGPNIPYKCTIQAGDTNIIGIFFIVAGIGIGMILANYLSKYKLEKQK